MRNPNLQRRIRDIPLRELQTTMCGFGMFCLVELGVLQDACDARSQYKAAMKDNNAAAFHKDLFENYNKLAARDKPYFTTGSNSTQRVQTGRREYPYLVRKKFTRENLPPQQATSWAAQNAVAQGPTTSFHLPTYQNRQQAVHPKFDIHKHTVTASMATLAGGEDAVWTLVGEDEDGRVQAFLHDRHQNLYVVAAENIKAAHRAALELGLCSESSFEHMPLVFAPGGEFVGTAWRIMSASCLEDVHFGPVV